MTTELNIRSRASNKWDLLFAAWIEKYNTTRGIYSSLAATDLAKERNISRVDITNVVNSFSSNVSVKEGTKIYNACIFIIDLDTTILPTLVCGRGGPPRKDPNDQVRTAARALPGVAVSPIIDLREKPQSEMASQRRAINEARVGTHSELEAYINAQFAQVWQNVTNVFTAEFVRKTLSEAGVSDSVMRTWSMVASSGTN